MLRKYEGSDETLIHTCNASKHHAHGPQKVGIFLHDVQPYMTIGDAMINIKYCPFCGCNIENDERRYIPSLTHEKFNELRLAAMANEKG